MKINEAIKLIGEKDFLDKVYQFSYRRCNTSYEAEDLCSDIVLAVISAVETKESIDNLCFCIDCCTEECMQITLKREIKLFKRSALKTVIYHYRQKKMKLIAL